MIDTAAWFVLAYLTAIDPAPDAIGWVLGVALWYYVLISARPKQ